MIRSLLKRGVDAARGVVSVGRGFFEGQHGVGYGVAEYEDFERIRREAREQDQNEGNAEAAGAELEVIATGTREVGAEALRIWLEVEDEAERPVLIDVRTQREYDAGHLPHALHIPLSDLDARLGELKNGKVVVAYSSSWTGGVDATYVLKRAGIDDARALAGGFDAWLEAKGPVVRG